MASANVWKSILPLDTMSDTSALVLPKWVASNWSTGTPELINWSMSSPCSLPRAATDPKIVPMSVRLRPEICAVSATVFNTSVICRPDLTPDADRLTATVAASPSPNAVPFTLASALSMMALMSVALWPRPLSLACAFSMFRARSKPPLAASAVMPPPTALTAPRPILPTLENAPVRDFNSPLPPVLPAAATLWPIWPSMVLPKSLPEGTTCTYTVPIS